MIPQKRIECAVARYWPDFAKIRQVTGASKPQVASVVAYLEALELGENVHICTRHRKGSVECRRVCGCACRECQRAGAAPKTSPADPLARAAAAYRRLSRIGVKAADMPEWVREGANAHRRRAEKRIRETKAHAA